MYTSPIVVYENYCTIQSCFGKLIIFKFKFRRKFTVDLKLFISMK